MEKYNAGRWNAVFSDEPKEEVLTPWKHSEIWNRVTSFRIPTH